MAASGPTIVAKFLADTKQLTSEVDKATSSASSKMSGFAKNAALAIGGAFAVAKIVEFGKASVQAAADDAEAQAQLAAALKNTTGATEDQIAAAEAYISNLSKSAAIADDELRPALATLARGFGDTEQAQRALTIATDVAAGTGKDLSAVTEAMMKAAQGNTGALKKMGIEVKNADGSAKSLDQIMSEMAKTFEGQAAVAAESTAGQMRNAQIQMGELQETIGAKLLPVVATLAGYFVNTLLPAIASVINFLTDHKDAVLAVFIGFATVVGAAVIPAFIAWAVAAGAAAIATIAAAAPFIAIGAVIAGVAYLIIHNWDDIVRVTKKTWDTILNAVEFVWDWIKNNWPLLLAIITGPIGAAVILVVQNWDTIKNAVMSAFNWIRDNWPLLLAIITGPIGLAVLTIARHWDEIKAGAQDVLNFITGIFDSIAGAITGAVGGIRAAAESVADAIRAPINAVIRAFNGLEFRIPKVDIPKVSIPGLPDVGGGSIGGQTVGFPNIPLLARGAVLTAPTLFVGGDAGTELVTPEALLRQIMSEETAAHYTLNIYPRRADAADVAYGFRRLELMAGMP
jgi:hypothetical protein